MTGGTVTKYVLNKDYYFYYITYDDGDSNQITYAQIWRHYNQTKYKPPILPRIWLDQTNLRGDQLASINGKNFGDKYPDKPGENRLIITFQNIGPQPNTLDKFKGIQTARAFQVSKFNIVMYAEISLNKRVMDHNDRFKERMKRINRGSQTYYNYNTNAQEV